MNAITRLSVLACLALPVSADLTDDKSLYDLAPDDAAFVRVINTTTLSVTATVGDKTFEANGGCHVTQVDWVNPGVTLSDDQSTQPGRLHTLIISNEGDRWHTAQTTTDPLKAQLALLNLTKDSEVSLVTTQGSRPVFSRVLPGERKTRAVNPISVSLTATDEQNAVELATINLRRGQVAENIICAIDGTMHSTLSIY